MGVLWYKILRDLWHHKGRTLQIILIIGIGAASIGMIMGTRNIMLPGMQDIWTRSSPAMLNIFVGPPVSEDVMRTLLREPGVTQVEGINSTSIEWRLNTQDEWKPANLHSRTDYNNLQLNKLELNAGSWPEGKKLAVELGSDNFFGIPMGGEVQIRVNDREETVEITGMVYNNLSQPAFLGGNPQFYSEQRNYERLVGSADFSQILVDSAQWDEAAVTEMADRLQAKLEKAGYSTGRMITDPNKHFFQDQIDGLFLLLTVMSILALILGLLLVYNTMNALIARQVDQIGVLKAIGARTHQVFALFLTATLIYGLLALFFALPVGILGGNAIAAWLVGTFGADPGGFELDLPSIILMAVITLVAPLIASIIPIISASRITVREAISTYGLSKKAGLIERVGAKIRFISRMSLLTISNTFRNKGRVVLMQIVLILSGLIFMMVVSTRDSIVYMVNDVIFDILGADVTFILERYQRIDTMEALMMAHPEVTGVELWALLNPTLRPAGQPESDDDETAILFGVPLPTQMYGYQLRQGRWLDPGDESAVILTTRLGEDVGVNVGDWVTMQYTDDLARDFQVVGLIYDPIFTNASAVPRDVLLTDLNIPGRAGTLWIDVRSQDAAGQIATSKALRQYLEDNHIQVSPQRGVFGIGGDATVETAQTLISQFNFIVVLLGLMAIIIAVVGSIALSGTISLSVMERTREIGVMRAIGASSWDVSRLFIGEGLILGWLSWLIALPLSVPAGKIMLTAISQAFRQDYLYHYTPTGALVWLGVITILSVLASWAPARSATRISVRESLAYQ